MRPADTIAVDSSGMKLGISFVRPGLTTKSQTARVGEKAVTESESGFCLWDFKTDTTEVWPYPETRDVTYLKPLPPEVGNGRLGGKGRSAVNLWQPDSELRHRLMPGCHPHESWVVAFSPDDSTIFTVGDVHQLRSWHTATGEVKAAAQPRFLLVSCVASRPTKLKAVGGYDNNVVILDSATLEVIATLTSHARHPRDCILT